MSTTTTWPYLVSLARLYGLTRFGEKLSLETPQALNAALGSPLKAYRSVLIGGTNGKGSTAAFLEAVLRGAGLRVGLFTSPHLISFRERIRVDGQMISEDTASRVSARVLNLADRRGITPSFFEAAWAMAACVFADAQVDVAIWEVGLGGRLDATNTCNPVASAVTTVALDHTHILGDTLDAIAREKVAIFRPGRPAMTAAQGPALAAIRAATSGRLAVVEPSPVLPDLPLPGRHQRRNAALAMALAASLDIEPDPQDLLTVNWPGRGERIGNILLDCAHNPDGAQALVEWIKAKVHGPLHLIYGAMAGKDASATVQILEEIVDSVAVVTPQYPRRTPAEALVPLFTKIKAVNAGSVESALINAPQDRLILVTGSCFLVGEARAFLTGQDFPECGILTTAR